MSEDNKKPKSESADELLRRARTLQGKTETTETIKKQAENAFNRTYVGSTLQDIVVGSRFLSQVARGLAAIYQYSLRPLTTHVVMPTVKFAARNYVKLWNWGVYRKDEEGVPYFSKRNAAIALGLTAAFAGAAYGIGVPAAYYAASNRTDTIYLTQSEEYAPDQWNVKGCYDLPCTDDNSIYYRIDNTLFHDIWASFNNRYPSLFFADFVGAAVQPGASKCEVHSYGYRFKLFSRYLERYPHILSVNCQPIHTAPDGTNANPITQASALNNSFNQNALPGQTAIQYAPAPAQQALPTVAHPAAPAL